MTDPYSEPNGTLRNSLGISNANELSEAEADIAAVELAILDAEPLLGSYDLAHLKAFHRQIFGSVYPWAGELRTIEISKGTSFCPSIHIVSYAQGVFRKLADNDHLQGLARPEFVRALADLYGDMNAIHPFREGNGRTQRAFLAQLTREAGYAISWQDMDREENIAASVASFNADNGLLEKMLDALLRSA
ncbi:Fic/DOC family protein [Streptomyces genisteinicus]|uniref:protein adenylyltransferase n=1 Tax=Streptomyces genisteinicus TaxID=2768068 RepID=A0A7H0HR87_9ACTN|nr:Fic family protein [Streptomyces genisteinicus]QNP63053.1 Fic family protein [Streptomyces genisteinicus]